MNIAEKEFINHSFIAKRERSSCLYASGEINSNVGK